MPPFLIQHGTKDATIPDQQSIALATGLGQVLGEVMVILDLIEGAEHLDPKFLTHESIDRVFRFLDAWLKTT